MRNVTITFVGDGSDDIAQKFYNLFVDGGFEDEIIDKLSNESIKVEGIKDFNNNSLSIAIKSSFPTNE